MYRLGISWFSSMAVLIAVSLTAWFVWGSVGGSRSDLCLGFPSWYKVPAPALAVVVLVLKVDLFVATIASVFTVAPCMLPSVKIQKMSLTAAAVVREGENVTHSFGSFSGALGFMWGISAGLHLGSRVSKRFLASFTQSEGCSQPVLQRVVHAFHLQ